MVVNEPRTLAINIYEGRFINKFMEVVRVTRRIRRKTTFQGNFIA